MSSPNYSLREPYDGDASPPLSAADRDKTERLVADVLQSRRGCEEATRRYKISSSDENRASKESARKRLDLSEEAVSQWFFERGIDWFECEGARYTTIQRVEVLSVRRGSEQEARDWLSANQLEGVLRPNGSIDAIAAGASGTLANWPESLFHLVAKPRLVEKDKQSTS